MKHNYQITGITCMSCVERVTAALLKVPHIQHVEVSKEKGSAEITMDQHIHVKDLQTALPSKYVINEVVPTPSPIMEMQTSTWFETYKPILLIFFYISLITLLIQGSFNAFNFEQWMGHFMSAFFFVFSFFKLLNLQGFADSYKMYDILAKRHNIWAYTYPFVELALAIGYLVNPHSISINLITFIVMLVSLIGVVQSVLDKRKIQCACLGAVFNLPMSTITIVEDLLMILMSGAMVLIQIV